MGIRPWEVALLTVQQFDDAIDAIDDYHRQQHEQLNNILNPN